MEAATGTAPRKLDSEKAQRIVAAMRDSVAERGAAASTFDVVASAAGVSRGLLHYYFGSKERLLVEVVRHDCDLRMAEMEERLSGAHSIEEIVSALNTQLEIYLEPAQNALIFELYTASRHNEDLRREMAELYRQVRGGAMRVLDVKQEEGVVKLRGSSEAVAAVLFALGDGIVLQMLSDPEWDSSEALEAGFATARFLLGE